MPYVVNNINTESAATETRKCFLFSTVALHVAVKNMNIQNIMTET